MAKASKKKAALKKTSPKKAAPKKAVPRRKDVMPLLFAKGKPWAVDCETHGHIGDFITEEEANSKKKEHLAEKGNKNDDVRVTGPQTEP
ncbi:MAG TPA: hypothetical protein VHD83_21150 [Puia sp.]|nr:hypothetical protein [Puia sp.]